MTKTVKSILFILLTCSILPVYAAVVVYTNHPHYYVEGRGYYSHQYCQQHKQWVAGHWTYRLRFHDRVWIPGHWVWVRWCN